MRLSQAVVLFACIQGALIIVPEPTPTAQTGIIVSKNKADRLQVQSMDNNCSSQTWPNFTAACLRNLDHEQSVQVARLATGDRR